MKILNVDDSKPSFFIAESPMLNVGRLYKKYGSEIIIIGTLGEQRQRCRISIRKTIIPAQNNSKIFVIVTDEFHIIFENGEDPRILFVDGVMGGIHMKLLLKFLKYLGARSVAILNREFFSYQTNTESINVDFYDRIFETATIAEKNGFTTTTNIDKTAIGLLRRVRKITVTDVMAELRETIAELRHFIVDPDKYARISAINFHKMPLEATNGNIIADMIHIYATCKVYIQDLGLNPDDIFMYYIFSTYVANAEVYNILRNFFLKDSFIGFAVGRKKYILSLKKDIYHLYTILRSVEYRRDL